MRLRFSKRFAALLIRIRSFNSTDAFKGNNDTVPAVLGRQAHYGQVIKTYAPLQDETRYSPAGWINVRMPVSDHSRETHHLNDYLIASKVWNLII